MLKCAEISVMVCLREGEKIGNYYMCLVSIMVIYMLWEKMEIY